MFNKIAKNAQKDAQEQEQRLNGLAAAFWEAITARSPTLRIIEGIESVASQIAAEAVKHGLTVTETEQVLSRVLNLAAAAGTRDDRAVVGYMEIAARMFGNRAADTFGRVKVSEISKLLTE